MLLTKSNQTVIAFQKICNHNNPIIDHFAVESPGTLPGLVRTNNIREIHFSRNPKIFEFLHEYEYVKEFGEGVDRMYREMEAAGLPEPEYRTVEFMLYATLKNHKWVEEHRASITTIQDKEQVREQVTEQVTGQNTPKETLILSFCAVPHSRKEIQEYFGLSGRRHFHDAYLRPLLDSGKLVMTIPDKPNSRNQKYVRA